jgi:hypothetical protein
MINTNTHRKKNFSNRGEEGGLTRSLKPQLEAAARSSLDSWKSTKRYGGNPRFMRDLVKQQSLGRGCPFSKRQRQRRLVWNGD